MTFAQAILANQRGPVISPSGEYFHTDIFSARAQTPNQMFSIQDYFGMWRSAGTSFAASVEVHGSGGILLHPQTGENFFNELSPYIGTVGQVTFSQGDK